MNEFWHRVEERQNKVGLVCVGLDPVWDRIPQSAMTLHGPSRHDIILGFLEQIVDVTADIACAYKPNRAFFAKFGFDGLGVLQRIIQFIHDGYPGIPVILDAKEGDIGPTNEGYVEEAFDVLKADAITLNPYLGQEAYKPFLDRKDKGLILLCRTSNLGSDELQCLTVMHEREGHGVCYERLYQVVARNIAERWNQHGNCALVAGATHPDEVGRIRQIIGDNMHLLVPGFGKQGGSVEQTIPLAINSRGTGVLANSSSGILYAGGGDDYALKARAETIRLRSEIDHYRLPSN